MEIEHPPAKIPKMTESEEKKEVMEALEKQLEAHDNNRKAVQDKLHKACEELHAQIDEMEDKINKELEEKYAPEDARLQAALNRLRENNTASALQKARAELLVFQSYELVGRGIESLKKEANENEGGDIGNDDHENYSDYSDYNSNEDSDAYHSDYNSDAYNSDYDSDNDDDDNNGNAVDNLHETDTKEPKFDLTTLYELNTDRHINLKWTEKKKKKPRNVCVTGINRGRVSVESICLNPDEERVVSECTSAGQLVYKCKVFKKGNEQWSTEYLLHKNESGSPFSFIPGVLEVGATYGIRVKMVAGDTESEWSDIAEFTTPEFKECCAWKECPDYVKSGKKYSVDMKNPRIASRLNIECCTIIGNTLIPLNTVTSWSVKIRKSRDNDGRGIWIGVAPFDINQNKYNNSRKCGWYFFCYDSDLWSGPPHNYNSIQEYGPRKDLGQYVHEGDSVGVVMDTTKGELSFVLNGVNHGAAYKGIPLGKPLVPCVLLDHPEGSIELVL